MGTTLENGVYLPSEGERNCYAGLKTNWEILDQKVADVTALQQAVAGALHREIVESLPTTDIDPNTIYMILSGTSATENVYNEYMYVNNAWELIGTSATDLTNYYTKAEVDGKLLLKANASDLTSHTGDTTIHVTTADKNRWNNNTYVFRYSSTALVASSTNSNALLDNTDNLKIGDKVIDSNGVLFSITAIDTVNSTFTVGSALIDLAKDSDVVHTSGNETIAGIKNFTDYTYIRALNFTNEVASPSSSDGAVMPIVTTITYTDQSPSQTARLNFRITANGDKSLYPHENNQYALGLTTRKWSEVHATSYYYGSSDTEFSDKFVTTDTGQTISANKTFVGSQYFKDNNVQYFGVDFSKGTAPSSYTARCTYFSPLTGGGSAYQTSNGLVGCAVDSSNVVTTFMHAIKNTAGTTTRTSFVLYYDTNNDKRSVTTNGDFLPINNASQNIGNSTSKWATINGLEPSALGMPDLANGIDISSYIDVSQTSQYTAPANGYISICGRASATNTILLKDHDYDFGITARAMLMGSNTFITYLIIPVVKNHVYDVICNAVTTLDYAKFYPCQGNV